MAPYDPNNPDPNALPPNYVVTPQGAVPQPVPVQAAPQPPPVVVQPAPTIIRETQPVLVTPDAPAESEHHARGLHEVRIYSHSNLFYWWPVWVIGFVAAALSYLDGASYFIGPDEQADSLHLNTMHPSSSLGVAFFMALFLVILITNVSVRGLASALVIMTIIVVTVLLAYFRLWDNILGFVAGLRIHLNSGAYFWFSTLMFLAWATATFVVDRMSFYRIKPGQVTHEFVLGASSKSYDTQNLVLEKFRDDLFRHWILGFGSGDLKIETSGARHETLYLPNVLFLGSKVQDVQKLIAMQPDEFGAAVIS